MSTTEETIIQAQRIVDLRQRMLKNIAAGLPAQEGITEEELRDAVNGIRSSRQVSGARGGTASGKAKSKADNSPADPTASKNLHDKLASLGLKLDLS